MNYNKALRNPGIIHQIQDNLMSLQGSGLFVQAIRDAAKDNVKGCIDLIIDKYRENSKPVKEIIGNDTLKLIEEFSGEQFLLT